MDIGRARQSVSRIKPMFRAEIQWLASGPTLKLKGRLVADWAEQARCSHKRRPAQRFDRRPHRTELCRFSGRTTAEVAGECRRAVCRRHFLCNCRMRPPAFIAHTEDIRATQETAWE